MEVMQGQFDRVQGAYAIDVENFELRLFGVFEIN